MLQQKQAQDNRQILQELNRIQNEETKKELEVLQYLYNFGNVPNVMDFRNNPLFNK